MSYDNPGPAPLGYVNLSSLIAPLLALSPVPDFTVRLQVPLSANIYQAANFTNWIWYVYNWNVTAVPRDAPSGLNATVAITAVSISGSPINLYTYNLHLLLPGSLFPVAGGDIVDLYLTQQQDYNVPAEHCMAPPPLTCNNSGTGLYSSYNQFMDAAPLLTSVASAPGNGRAFTPWLAANDCNLPLRVLASVVVDISAARPTLFPPPPDFPPLRDCTPSSKRYGTYMDINVRDAKAGFAARQ